MAISFGKSDIRPQRGFVALISTVIIAALLIGLALSVGGNGVFARFDVLNSEFKRVSLGLAESCANVALLRVAQNYDYQPAPGGDPVFIGTDAQGRDENCVIQSISFPNGKADVQNTAVVKAWAQYPDPNGANSSVAISATVQNPNSAVPAKGSVTVVLNVVNDDGGAKQSSDFDVSVSATNAYPLSFKGAGGSGTTVLMDAGSFAIVPAGYAGYSEVDSGCTGTILAGESKTCTITESDDPTTATLTVIAQMKNDNGGTNVPTDFALFLDGQPVVSGVPQTGLASGNHTVHASAALPGYTASVWGYDCDPDGNISLSIGNKKTCTIIFDDVPPPAPICVDTVLMLDRTGSMNATDLADERTAASGLLNLYKPLSPVPKSAVGVFGAVGSGEPYNAGIMQALTTNYTNLLNAVTIGLSNSDGSTNLASAISTAQAEFAAHGTPGKGHALILLSDGGANRPAGTVNADTGFNDPSASTQNAPADAWSNPSAAYADGGSDASGDAVPGERERFYNFNFPAIPSGATIRGIEADADAWSTTSTVVQTPGTSTRAPSAAASPNQWTNPTRAFGSDNSYATDSAADDEQGYGNFGLSIPSNAIIAGVEIDVQAHSSDSSGCRVGAELSSNAGTSFTSTGLQTAGSIGSGDNTFPIGGSSSLWNRAWAPGDFANGKFVVRLQNVHTSSCSSSATLSVDQVTTTVYYTVPAPAPSRCQLRMDLSWDGGGTWTPEKTQNLTETPATHAFGSATDDWSATHTWTPAQFSNGTFVARVHASDPGSSCDNASADHLDWLRVKVSYRTAVDPYEAAYEAADAAKEAGTEIFTVHYGDKGTGNRDINFLANIANGSTPVSGHDAGSANDLSDSAVSGNTGYISPSDDQSDSGGDGNGFESNPSRAYADGGGANGFALNANGVGDRHRYGRYSLSIPAGASVSGIVVRPDWWVDNTSGTNSVSIELSWDGGAHWTSAKTQSSESTSDTNNKTVGASNDSWGRGWTASDLSSGNFIVRITSNCSGSSSCSSRNFYLDWLAVEVYYSGGVPENGDDDNFFVSPTSSDMQGIFEAIGEKVCPALTAPPPPPAPTKGTLIVITHVVNDSGGTNVAGDFIVNVSGLNPSQSSFYGSESPGVSLTLDPGPYSVSQAASGLLYVKSLGANCSGSISAGDVLTCAITDDDIPPPPAPLPTAPPPPATVNIGSWQEVP